MYQCFSYKGFGVKGSGLGFRVFRGYVVFVRGIFWGIFCSTFSMNLVLFCLLAGMYSTHGSGPWRKIQHQRRWSQMKSLMAVYNFPPLRWWINKIPNMITSLISSGQKAFTFYLLIKISSNGQRRIMIIACPTEKLTACLMIVHNQKLIVSNIPQFYLTNKISLPLH